MTEKKLMRSIRTFLLLKIAKKFLWPAAGNSLFFWHLDDRKKAYAAALAGAFALFCFLIAKSACGIITKKRNL